ncbi:MAG: endonuclease/exonuclease/phosphatase family protein [Halieaceae bacterium]
MRNRFSPAKNILASIFFLTACSATPVENTGASQLLAINIIDNAAASAPSNILKVASLNIAHGRGDSLNQLLVSSNTIQENLDSIADFLQKHDVHVAALQEVDAPSSWSGKFDHAEHIATQANYRWWIQASHASLGIADYGTAIVSSMPITAAGQLDFTPSPPTAGKGFTVAEVQWQRPGVNAITVDVVSLHMDFSRKSVRERQVEELDQTLKKRTNPLILMGDFNSEVLAEELVNSGPENKRRLHTWPADSDPHYSYKKKRLDWIIISGELEFVDYTTAKETLSDHHAVVASLRLRD